MHRRHRLRESSRISQVHRLGRSAANRFLVFRVTPNGLDRSRFCFIAGKRVGNAVVRNRVKRRLREAARQVGFAPGWDAIVMARRGAGDADYRQLERSVDDLMRRTGVSEPETVR